MTTPNHEAPALPEGHASGRESKTTATPVAQRRDRDYCGGVQLQFARIDSEVVRQSPRVPLCRTPSGVPPCPHTGRWSAAAAERWVGSGDHHAAYQAGWRIPWSSTPATKIEFQLLGHGGRSGVALPRARKILGSLSQERTSGRPQYHWK